MSDCLFCKIASGAIAAEKLYEDKNVLAFHDIHPVSKVHFLLIPKQHIDSLFSVSPGEDALLGKLIRLAPVLAAEQGLSDGFKTSINTGPGGGQVVYHLHVHVFGGGPIQRMPG